MKQSFFIKFVQDRNKRIMANTILQLTNFIQNPINRLASLQESLFRSYMEVITQRDVMNFLFTSSTSLFLTMKYHVHTLTELCLWCT